MIKPFSPPKIPILPLQIPAVILLRASGFALGSGNNGRGHHRSQRSDRQPLAAALVNGLLQVALLHPRLLHARQRLRPLLLPAQVQRQPRPLNEQLYQPIFGYRASEVSSSGPAFPFARSPGRRNGLRGTSAPCPRRALPSASSFFSFSISLSVSYLYLCNDPLHPRYSPCPPQRSLRAAPA